MRRALRLRNFAGALLLAALAPVAQGGGATAPFLWQIAGSGGAHYLLGSVHMLPATAHPLPPALGDAYARTDVLVFESDLARLSAPELQLEMLNAALDAAPGGLRATVDARTYARLGAQARRLGLPDTVCDSFRAWFCALTLEIASFQLAGFSPQHGIDHYFHTRAVDDGKTIAWLEAPDQHLALFTQMPEELGPPFLEATLDSIASPDGRPSALVQAWRNGDTAFLSARVEALRLAHPQAYRRLLAERNRRWLPALETRLRGARPTLVIVGAAHLVGDDGLVAGLRARGFSLQPVR